jgi:DnaK suppressor protein
MRTKDHYRKLLLDLRKELSEIQASADEAEQVVELDQTRVGRLSRMDAMQAQAMAVETGRRRRIRLRQVEAALERLEQGEFGYCQECGEDISDGRLEIDPAALLCIACASDREAPGARA